MFRGSGDDFITAEMLNSSFNCLCDCRLLKECNVLISKAFRGQLVISEFSEFTVDVTEIYSLCGPNMAGTPAQYIPQLARGDPAKWSVSLCTIDGQRFHIGDVHDRFSIQSTRLVRIFSSDLM